MKIRKANWSDVKEIFELINKLSNTDSFMRPITKQEILKELDNFLIVEEKEFCGCGRIVTYSEVCEICSICIKEVQPIRLDCLVLVFTTTLSEIHKFRWIS